MDCAASRGLACSWRRYLALFLLLGGLLAACRAEPTPSPIVRLETPCLAELQLSSTPAGAAVYLDGEWAGATPLRVMLPPGAVQVTLRREGYAAHRAEVALGCDESFALAPTLLDVAPPTITLGALSARVTPEEGLKVTAQAADNEAVASLSLYVNDALLHTVQEPALRFNVDTRPLGSGLHQGRVVARDAAGNEAMASFAFEIVAPTLRPETPTLATLRPSPTATSSPTALPTATPTGRPSPTPAPSHTPRPTVALSQGQVTLLVYDYERALYTDTDAVGRPYPLLDHDRVGPPVSRSYSTLALRNEYLEVVILPELGGRIYQIRFLPTDQALLYNSRVAKPTHWGPEDQGWWLALGGIEFALPVDEHGYLTAQPWEASASRGADGSATVAVSILEQTRQLDARIEITLRPREAAIHLRTTLHNRSGQSQSFQYWVNAMLSPGRHGVGPELRFSLPADTVLVHSSGDPALPPDGSAMPWPLAAGRDLSRYGQWRNWLGVFAPQLRAPFAAVYDEATQIGMVHAFDPAIIKGSKLFGFGRDFDHSVYADDGAQYVELWGGLTPTFWDYTALGAGERMTWDDTWYVVAQSGGVSFANAAASLYARRDGERLHLAVASPGERRWRLVVSQGDAALLDQAFSVRPDAPHRVTVDIGNTGQRVDVLVLGGDGTTVLQYRVD